MPKQIADWLQERLRSKGVSAVLETEHRCMPLRGAQTPGARTVTSALHGPLRGDSRGRDVLLSLHGAGIR